MARAGTRAAPAPGGAGPGSRGKGSGSKPPGPRPPPPGGGPRPGGPREEGKASGSGERGGRGGGGEAPSPAPRPPGGPRRASPGGGGGGPPRRGRCRGPRPRRARRTAPPYARPVRVLQVALPLPLPPMSYLPPLGQEGEEALGRRVAVPFRGRSRWGWWWGKGAALPEPPPRHRLPGPRPLPAPGGDPLFGRGGPLPFRPLGQVLADFLPLSPLRHRVRLYPGADPGPAPGAWGPGGLAGGPGL